MLPADDLATALAAIAPPPGWVLAEPTTWRDPTGLVIHAAAEPGTCVERGGFAGVTPAPYFHLSSAAIDRVQGCLQRPADVVIVTFAWTPAGAGVEQIRAADALRAAIADVVRPAVTIAGVGEVRPRLALIPTADGAALVGLPAPAGIRLRSQPGTCGAAPPDPALPLTVMAPSGERWAGDARADARTAMYCLERSADALTVIVDGPLAGPAGPTGGPPVAVRAEVIEVLAALHAALAHGDPAPRWYGGGHDTVALPQVGVTLRGRESLDAGWAIDRTPGRTYKLIDGATLGEPGVDLLVPRWPTRHAVGFSRGPCAADRTAPAAGLIPAELGAIAIAPGPTWRALACVHGRAADYQVIIRAIDDAASADPDEVRDLIGGFARSVGVPIAGRPMRFDNLVLLAVPIVTGDDGTSHGGLAVRARATLMVGRPWSLVGRAEVAFGVAGDAFHAGEPAPSGPDEETLELPGDVLGELRGGGGVAYSVGPVTADALVGAALAAYWPDDSWLDASVGVGYWRGRERIGVRYGLTPLRLAHAVELTYARPRFAALVRFQTFPTDQPAHDQAGSPNSGLELAVGLGF